MRTLLLAIGAMALTMGSAAADTVNGTPTPSVIANHANGKNYQPTPDVVAPRPRAAGVLPQNEHQAATDQDLAKIDRSLLRSEGKSTASVPALPPPSR